MAVIERLNAMTDTGQALETDIHDASDVCKTLSVITSLLDASLPSCEGRRQAIKTAISH